MNPCFRVLLAAIPWIVANHAAAELAWTVTERNLTADLMRSEVETTFPFVNKGKMPVTIREVTTSCGCTVADLRKKTYAPGENGEIGVVVHYTGDVSTVGTSVAIVTDEPETSARVLSVKVSLPEDSPKGPLQVRPPFVRWSRGAYPAPQAVNIYMMDPGSPVRPVAVASDDKTFRVELREPRVDEPRVYEVIITPLDMKQPRQAIITLTTTRDPLQPKGAPPLTYRVMAMIK